jgi:phospholipid/cholesterol/gamma-HCH transport system substrate-binding protein
MQDRALELKVGLVLLAAFVVLGGFVLLLGDLHLRTGLQINVDYNFSGSIQAGAPVRVSGIKVGRVADVVFLGEELDKNGMPVHVRLVLSIEDRAKPVLRENTEFYVNTQGLLGENYVEIVPHPGKSPALVDGAAVRGSDPARFDLLFSKLYDFLQAVSELMHENRDVFVDLLRSGSKLATTLDKALLANEQDLSRAISNGADAAERAKALLASMQTAIGDGKKLGSTISDVSETSALFKKKLPETLAKVQRALDEINRLEGALKDVDREKVNAILKNASSALEEASATLQDARVIAKRVRTGQGTIGLLVQDDEVYDDLKELLKDIKEHPWKMIWKD